MIDPIPFIFIAVFVFLIAAFFGLPYYMDHLPTKFINDRHLQLIKERDQARKQHKPTKHIINKIKALVRAELGKE